MKLKELQKQSTEQLAGQLNDLRLELAKDRAASEIGTVKNPGRIRSARKSIARIKTIVNLRNIQSAKTKGAKAKV